MEWYEQETKKFVKSTKNALLETLKPIETYYKNCRFRSRLEARWAVFFDALDIKWEYEVDGYEKKIDEDRTIKYLPDFYLPQTETWVEVKSSPEMLVKKSGDYGPFLDYGSPLPGIDNSTYEFDNFRIHGLLVLYSLPYIKWGICLHPIITHSKGLNVSYAFFTYHGLHRLSKNETDILGLFTQNTIEEKYIDGIGSDARDWNLPDLVIETKKAHTKVLDAYKAARQARFEHGEKG